MTMAESVLEIAGRAVRGHHELPVLVPPDAEFVVLRAERPRHRVDDGVVQRVPGAE
jgi:hypothetical protein